MSNKNDNISSGHFTLSDNMYPISANSFNISTVDMLATIDDKGNIEFKTQDALTILDKDGIKYDVLDFIKTVNARLCILQPDFENHEQYPALKDAYEQYKMLEKLLLKSKNAKKD